jgi:predicted ArsR family transcriptional regulator
MTKNAMPSQKNTAYSRIIRDVHLKYIAQQILILNALKKRLGPAVADIAAETHAREAAKPFLVAAHEKGMSSVDDLVSLLWEPLRVHGYEFTVARAEGNVRIHCTSCPFAALYRQMGGSDWGYRLYCAADAYLVKEFNKNIGFRRTKTLMEGDNCCDHFYYMKEQDEANRGG